MADEPIRITDGTSHCRVADPASGTIQVLLAEISLNGALLEAKKSFDVNAYLDVTVMLKGQPPRQFFANVVSSTANGVRLQWTHIDPSELDRLKALLEAYKFSLRAATGEPRTRRLVRPSATTITPFAEADAVATPEKPGEAVVERVRTRRVLRPSAAPSAQSAEAEPDPAPVTSDDDSRASPVVVPTTDRITATISRSKPGTDPTGTEAPEPQPGESSSSSSARTVIGQDGRMDIGATIRNKAKTVRASDLAARHDRVRVLNMATIKQLIQEAVEEAANHLTRALGEADRKRLLEEAEESFKERLKSFEEEKAGAEQRNTRLTEQLEAAQRLLADERKRTISADQFTVSAQGLDEIEAKFKRLLDAAIAQGQVMPTLEEELRRVIATVFDSERQRIREQEMQAQNATIELLQKKISRLASSLTDTERQRDEMAEWARAMEAGGAGALRNVFTAGIKGSDPLKLKKLALMKEILEMNRSIRKELGIELNAVDDAVAAMAAGETVATSNTIDAAPVDAVEPVPGDPDEPWEEGKRTIMVGAGAQAISADGVTELSEGAEINPDDLPWEAPAVSDKIVDSAVKRIAADTDFVPPPREGRAS